MAYIFDVPTSVLHEIKIQGCYHVTEEGKITYNCSAIRIVTHNEKQCSQESFNTGWRVVYIAIKQKDGSIQMLKIQRKEANQGNVTVFPIHGSSREDDEKQSYYDGSFEKECHAIGHMTLTPRDGFRGDFGVMVLPIEAKFYICFPSPLRRVFGYFLSSFNYETERFFSPPSTTKKRD